MPNTYIKNAGTWRQAQRIFYKNGGIQYNIRKIYKKYNGAWQLVFGNAPATLQYTTPGIYYFTVPPGVTQITVTACGGSGGGGWSAWTNNGLNYGGGGGGASNVVSGTFAVVASQIYSIGVGAGGAQSNGPIRSGGYQGQPGIQSYVSNLLTAFPGQGGGSGGCNGGCTTPGGAGGIGGSGGGNGGIGGYLAIGQPGITSNGGRNGGIGMTGANDINPPRNAITYPTPGQAGFVVITY